jgi:hypothetical protein
MSSSYYCYVIPDPALHDYAPTSDTAAAVVRALDAIGYVYRGESAVEIRTLGEAYKKQQVAGAAVADAVKSSWNGVDFLRVDLLPIDALCDPDDGAGPVTTGSAEVVAFRNSWSVSLQVAPHLSVVPPDGPQGTTYPCPTCGRDTWSVIEVIRPVQERINWAMPFPVGAACPHCSAPLLAVHMSAITPSGVDGSPKHERCPVFRMCMLLITDTPPPDSAPAAIDDTLVRVLRDVTGVGFRALGRFT